MQIEFIDAASLESHFRSSQDLPPERREVYLKDGLSVEDAEEANEIVPIVKVIMLPQNDQGELVDKAVARQILIREYGEGDRLLRETRMLKT